MYPNPAQNEVYFDITGFAITGDVAIAITSIDGRLLKSFRNVSKINTADLLNGMYFVIVKKGNFVSTQKLIIEK